ncbi:MAG: ATP-binding cassette domain-containing protein [Caenispirillum sp.]|nr:ATP-binding cassette domain-containing protein [Caenispirillum sp.]
MVTGVTGALYELEDVGVAVAGREILAGLSLRLTEGRIYGLIGPNGSGKSTLVRLLARQQAPARGRVRFRGGDLAALAPRDFARAVAYMPQFTPPSDGMTVRELVSLGRFPWHGPFGRFGAEDAAKVEAALADTGLAAFADRLVDTLSGGERQRVWLAMMIAQDARCLLLDEPTSALDVAHQVDMLDLVRTLGRARGLTAVVVLHDVNMAARLCDEILALRGGRLIHRGPPETLMTPATLAEVYDIALGILPHPATGEPISYVETFRGRHR